MDQQMCQACKSRPVTEIIADDDPIQPYQLCSDCARRLKSRALRPREWFNLAAIHSHAKHLLHSDFYDQDGTADQAEEEVEAPELFPAPTLEAASADLDLLLDYAMSRWRLADDLLQVLRTQDMTQLFSGLVARVESADNYEIESRAYAICALVLGPLAGDWIRARWAAGSERVLFTLAEASAACLPADEGFARVVAALEAMPRQDLVDSFGALAWFQSEKTLDWIEGHQDYMVNRWRHVPDNWGRLAAVSHLTWQRAAAWLAGGRPLSLVSLDALAALCRYNTRLLEMLAPKLIDPASPTEMAAQLRAYAAKDDVPRVERDVAYLIARLDVLAGLVPPEM